MRTRKPLKSNTQSKNWVRTPGGGYCDICGEFLAGFLTPHVNRKTGRRLCPKCYQAGYK